MKRPACLLMVCLILALLLSACASRTPEVIEILATRIVTPTPYGYVAPTEPPPTAAVTSTPPPRLTYQIAFESNGTIYVMNADGSGLTRLEDGHDPQWSPDGTRIVFYSEREGNNEIRVMNRDGTGIWRLTDDPGTDAGPRWSPDGTQIAFYSDRDGNYEIYLMNADGRRLLRMTADPAEDRFPVWSPDGERILFQHWADTNGDGNYDGQDAVDIYSVGVDGTGLTNLTNEGTSFGPIFSPNGQLIAFTAGRFPDGGVYVMNADGTGWRLLLPSASADAVPMQWTPDGETIVVDLLQGNQWDLAFLDAGGSGLQNLTNSPEPEYLPMLSPDGSQVAFLRVDRDSDGDGQLYGGLDRDDLYVMNRDGTGLKNLTNSPGHHGDPHWSPVLLPALPDSGFSLSDQ